MSEDLKTIKELADEIGVSKQAVWQKIKKESSILYLSQNKHKNLSNFCFGITTFPVFCSSFFLNSYLSFPFPINSPLGTFTVFVSYLAPNLLMSAFFDVSPANATTSLFVRSNSFFLSSNGSVAKF